ncbi:MAG: PHP domain-containing protein, partial [Clostridioides sp.]|nr:PHP domain-containing protein [Clostridioides sp.]
MKLIADYHTHTVYSGKSHAKGTIEENVKVAIDKGLKTIGISDHGYSHIMYGLNKKNIPNIREEIDILNEKYKEINILFGVECNILDDKGNIDMDEHFRKYFDYVMAGYHYGSMPTGIRSLCNHFENYVLKSEKACIYNTKAIVNAMKNNDIFCITHPGDNGKIFIEEVSDVALKTNTFLEINSSHGFLTVEELRKIL